MDSFDIVSKQEIEDWALPYINRVVNDMYRAVNYQKETENSESWGFGDTEIEIEVF
jgi:hypothetical protein